jgi:hypothetical protein
VVLDYTIVQTESSLLTYDGSYSGRYCICVYFVIVSACLIDFYQVRCAAIEALAKLACKCEKMIFGAANLLLDMLNEEVEVVRMQAMHALSQLATAGYLSVHDQHLHLVRSGSISACASAENIRICP